MVKGLNSQHFSQSIFFQGMDIRGEGMGRAVGSLPTLCSKGLRSGRGDCNQMAAGCSNIPILIPVIYSSDSCFSQRCHGLLCAPAFVKGPLQSDFQPFQTFLPLTPHPHTPSSAAIPNFPTFGYKPCNGHGFAGRKRFN